MAKSYILLTEALERGLVSQRTIDTIGTTCECCNSPLAVSNTIKTLFCTNTNCPEKFDRRTELMLKELNFKGFGESTCKLFRTECYLEKPYEIFTLEPNEFPDSLSVDMVEKLYLELHSKDNFTLDKLLKSMILNNIADDSSKLLNGYTDIEQFFNDLENMGEELIVQQLGINTYGGKSLDIMEELLKNKQDIIEYMGLFDVVVVRPTLYPIAITGEVTLAKQENGDSFKSKDQFMKYINKLSKDGDIIRKDSITKKTKYVISDNPNSKTSKITKARDKGIPIITSERFIEIVKGDNS